MKNLLKLEEAGQFLLSIILFQQLDYAWWVFPACILLPDLSMIAYAAGPGTGAWCYNFFHHKLLAVVLWGLGLWINFPLLTLAGVILFGHSAMDRIFGYGLKFSDSFNHTHLGLIKRKEENNSPGN